MNYDLGYPPSDPSERYEPRLRMYRKAAVSRPTVPNALPSVPDSRTYREHCTRGLATIGTAILF